MIPSFLPFTPPGFFDQGDCLLTLPVSCRGVSLTLELHQRCLLLSAAQQLILTFEFGTTFQILRSKTKFIPGPEGKPRLKEIGEPEGIAFQKEDSRIQLQAEPKSLARLKDKLLGLMNQVGFHQLMKPIKKLGKGNFGTVYLVQRFEDGSVVAAKSFLKYSIYSNQNGKQSLQNEVKIMRQFNHPNLMRVFQIFQSKNSIYMLVEQLKGGNLSQLMGRLHQFKPGEIKLIMKGLLEGLACMHSQRVMHRDIKPQNIMFRNQNLAEVVLADFGLATNCDLEEYLFTRCGTPGYVAPEVINLTDLKARYDPVCDIYSLGCIFYEMLTSRRLFNGLNQNDLLRLNKSAFVDFKMSDFLEMEPDSFDLIRKMLEKDPKARITAREALQHRYFRNIQKTQLLAVPRIPASPPVLPQSKKAEESVVTVASQRIKVEYKKQIIQSLRSKGSSAQSKQSKVSKEDKLKDSIGEIVIRNANTKKTKQLKLNPSFAQRLANQQQERRASRGRKPCEQERNDQSEFDKPGEAEGKLYQRQKGRRKVMKLPGPQIPRAPNPERDEGPFQVVLKLSSKHQNLVIVGQSDQPYQITIITRHKVKAYAL